MLKVIFTFIFIHLFMNSTFNLIFAVYFWNSDFNSKIYFIYQNRFLCILHILGSSVVQWEKIKETGVKELCHHIIVSGDIGIEKPQREIFDLACQQMKVYFLFWTDESNIYLVI